MLYKLSMSGYDKYRFLAPDFGALSSFTLEFRLDDFDTFEEVIKCKLQRITVRPHVQSAQADIPIVEYPNIGNVVLGVIKTIVENKGGCLSSHIGEEPAVWDFSITLDTPTERAREIIRQRQKHLNSELRLSS